jgi:GxxExxY protein
VISPDHLHSALTHRILGCAFRVHNTLGGGLPESVYQGALEIALSKARIRFKREMPIHVLFEGEIAGKFYVDFAFGNDVVVEIKAVRELAEEHSGQLLGYMKAGRFPVGLLLNFGPVRVEAVRKVMSQFARSA